MNLMEQPSQTNVENIETARLEKLRADVENIETIRLEKLRADVENTLSELIEKFNSEKIAFSVKVKNENDQLFVTLFQNGEWVFDAYSVFKPFEMKLEGGEKTTEDHVIKNAYDAIKRWIDNPQENRQFEISKQKLAA